VAAAYGDGDEIDSRPASGPARTYRWERNILSGLERTPPEALRRANAASPQQQPPLSSSPPSSARTLPQSQGREVHVMSPGSAVLATLTVRVPCRGCARGHVTVTSRRKS
jgi:hypothetical protein